MITKNDCSIDEYFEKTKEEKEKFYKEVFETSQAKNKADNDFTQYIPKRKMANAMQYGEHQEEGRLMFVDKIQRGTSQKYYLLCLCDCGNWTIVRQDAFKSKTTNGGAFSCGCLNNEKRDLLLNSKEYQEKRNKSIVNNLIEQHKIPQVGEILYGWKILESEMRLSPDGSSKRRYIKGICPQCKQPSQWIRFDGIQAGTVIGCGCSSGGPDSAAVKKIIEILDANNIPYTREKTFDSCVNPTTGKKLRYDFFVDGKYLIEYDGEQHFKPGFGGDRKDLKEQQDRDVVKNQWCKDNNIPLIRIPYTKNHLNLTLEDIMLDTTKFQIC